MKDVLEAIAQQIDKVAQKPLEAAFLIAGVFAFWQWLGWPGAVLFLIVLVVVSLLVDVIVYLLCSRQTYAKYGDSTVWLSGFHPFKARAMARTCDRAIKRYGERAFLNELHRLARENDSEITVTATDAEGNKTTRSTLPLEEVVGN